MQACGRGVIKYRLFPAIRPIRTCRSTPRLRAATCRRIAVVIDLRFRKVARQIRNVLSKSTFGGVQPEEAFTIFDV